MIKNKVYFSALFLFFSFGQSFGITEELKLQTCEIFNEFFIPGPNPYMATIGNLWREFEGKSENWYYTGSETEADKVYMLIGFSSAQTLDNIIFKCEEFQNVYYDPMHETIQRKGYRYIFHSLRFQLLNEKLHQFEQIQDFASSEYAQLIKKLDLLVARIETAGLVNETKKLSSKLTFLVCPKFVLVSKKQDLCTAKENRLMFLKHLTFSLLLFALTIERGLFDRLTKSKKIELCFFINELVDKKYPYKTLFM